MKKILVLLGPNLNMTGIREKGIYGEQSFESINEETVKHCGKKSFDCEIFQSNHEGKLIDKIHESMGQVDGIIINAGGLTHYSISLRDALSCLNVPCIEVHMTNIYSRDKLRRTSVISEVCRGVIAGFGKNVYFLAVDALAEII